MAEKARRAKEAAKVRVRAQALDCHPRASLSILANSPSQQPARISSGAARRGNAHFQPHPSVCNIRQSTRPSRATHISALHMAGPSSSLHTRPVESIHSVNKVSAAPRQSTQRAAPQTGHAKNLQGMPAVPAGQSGNTLVPATLPMSPSTTTTHLHSNSTISRGTGGKSIPAASHCNAPTVSSIAASPSVARVLPTRVDNTLLVGAPLPPPSLSLSDVHTGSNPSRQSVHSSASALSMLRHTLQHMKDNSPGDGPLVQSTNQSTAQSLHNTNWATTTQAATILFEDGEWQSVSATPSATQSSVR